MGQALRRGAQRLDQAEESRFVDRVDACQSALRFYHFISINAPAAGKDPSAVNRGYTLQINFRRRTMALPGGG